MGFIRRPCWRLAGGLRLFAQVRFVLPNEFFVKNVFINGGAILTGREKVWSMGWSSRVLLALLVAHFTATSQLINYIRTAQLLRS